jgi:hypothetical protein
VLGRIVESARSIPYGGINLLEIMYSLDRFCVKDEKREKSGPN